VRTPPRGLPAALNTALAHARAPLLARHDADDLSHRDRLALQVEALCRDPGLAVVGARLRLFPAAGSGVGMRRWAEWHNALLDHESMARELLVDSPLAHGTALLRRDWLERVGGWQERGWAEDLDLWARLLEAGARFAKLPRVLYAWRQHPGSATRQDPRYARARMTELKCGVLARTLLAGARTAQVIGVGTSLAHWAGALRRTAPRVEAHEVRRPTPAALAALPAPAARAASPLVLVFGSAPARARWRAALAAAGWVEGRDFAFVA
jgi:hypothetical protein